MRIRAKVIVKNYEIEERRKKLGYSQNDFADVLGIQRQKMADIENLKIKPSEELAKQISLELNCDLKTLFPQGYDKVVDIFKLPIGKIVDYKNPLLDNGIDEQLLLEQSNAKITIDYLIKKAFLSPRELAIIRFRNGFEDEIPHTYEETGIKFNVTCERIRQIEARAHEKIRRFTEEEGIRSML